MIVNYFSFVEALKTSTKQKIFILLGISAFLDMVCNILVYLEKWMRIDVNYAWLKCLTVIAIILFFIFCWQYSVSKSDGFKYKQLYLSVLITLCLTALLIYIIRIFNNQTCMLEIPLLIYEVYTFIRLVFILHILYYLKKQ